MEESVLLNIESSFKLPKESLLTINSRLACVTQPDLSEKSHTHTHNFFKKGTVLGFWEPLAFRTLSSHDQDLCMGKVQCSVLELMQQNQGQSGHMRVPFSKTNQRKIQKLIFVLFLQCWKWKSGTPGMLLKFSILEIHPRRKQATVQAP